MIRRLTGSNALIGSRSVLTNNQTMSTKHQQQQITQGDSNDDMDKKFMKH